MKPTLTILTVGAICAAHGYLTADVTFLSYALFLLMCERAITAWVAYENITPEENPMGVTGAFLISGVGLSLFGAPIYLTLALLILLYFYADTHLASVKAWWENPELVWPPKGVLAMIGACVIVVPLALAWGAGGNVNAAIALALLVFFIEGFLRNGDWPVLLQAYPRRKFRAF